MAAARRPFPWGLAGLLLGFVLLAPPIFFFAPLAALLVASRPRGAREWFWLAASLLLAWLWASAARGNLAEAVTAAAGLMAGGLLLAVVLATSWPLFRQAMVAAAGGTLAAAAWAALLGQSWAAVQASFARGLTALFSTQADLLAQRGVDASVVTLIRDAGASTARLSQYLAALLVLEGLAGLALAVRWQAELARRPVRARPAPFHELRFSDQWVWVLAVATGVVLLKPAAGSLFGVPAYQWAANVLVVAVASYALRGLAIYRAAARLVSRRVSIVLAVVALLALPYAALGLALLGLADGWMDFRRRLRAPQPEDGTDD